MYPILFEFGFITVFSLWLFIAIGFVVGSSTFIKLAKRQRVKLTVLSDRGLKLFFWTLVISRVVFIAFHYDLYFYQFSLESVLGLFAIWDKGLSFWGAVFAWFSGIWHFARQETNGTTESTLRLFDLMIPALLLGMAFGNIGSFMDGVNYGSPTDLPWGVTFRSANVKYITPVHPTQIYSAIYTLSLGWLLVIMLKKIRGQLPGFISELGLFVFSVLKFTEEFFRGDETVKLFSIRLPQLMAACGIIIAGYLIYNRYKNLTGSTPHYTFKKFILLFSKKYLKRGPEEIAANRCQTDQFQNSQSQT